MQFTKGELDEIIAKHGKWLRDEDGGVMADLRGAKLRGADLVGADLRGADLRGAKLRGADLVGAKLRGADLRGADLREANLSEADLREADIDYASFTLSCSFSRFTTDLRIVYQLLAHVCSLKVEGDESAEFDAIKSAIMPYAVKSHRADDLVIREVGK